MLKLVWVFALVLSVGLHLLMAQDRPLKILVIGAHPDDCEINVGGTAALFAEMGHKVKFISVTNGNAGHHEIGGTPLYKRRLAESLESARRLGIEEYELMSNDDGLLMPTLENRLQIIRKIREWDADVVISHRTNDYHPDHRYTGILVQDAAYMVAVPNIAPDVPALKKNPVFLYSYDRFQRPNPFRPDITVIIDQSITKKILAMDAHVSQFYEWLPWIGGYADQVPGDPARRSSWLAERWRRPVSDEMRKSLEKWYGTPKAKAAQHAEAFEICEYGRQPSDEEIKLLFPMLGK
ncbi:MAG: PIG-L family deacetylase [Cyclobacteriaceae bacterium]|nr:PIG-L family deacetylase [Cyclobacteriaceae bacterium]